MLWLLLRLLLPLLLLFPVHHVAKNHQSIHFRVGKYQTPSRILTADASGGDVLLQDTAFIDRFIMLPRHKLLFCQIEKVANTAFAGVFSALPRGTIANYAAVKKSLHQTHKPALYHYYAPELSRLLADRAWYKAVFCREPLERFLSAFRSKCERGFDSASGNCSLGAAPSFSQAVAALFHTGRFTDPHFARQTEFCGGFDNRTVEYWDAIELLRPLSSRENLLRVLRAANVSVEGSLSRAVDLNFPAFPALDTFQLREHSNGGAGSRHQTNSSASHVLRRYYRHPCYIRGVVDFYRRDYETFGIEVPAWAMSALGNTSREACLSMFPAPNVTTKETAGDAVTRGRRRGFRSVVRYALAGLGAVLALCCLYLLGAGLYCALRPLSSLCCDHHRTGGTLYSTYSPQVHHQMKKGRHSAD